MAMRANMCLNGRTPPVETAILGHGHIETVDALKLVDCQKLAPERRVDPIRSVLWVGVRRSVNIYSFLVQSALSCPCLFFCWAWLVGAGTGWVWVCGRRAWRVVWGEGPFFVFSVSVGDPKNSPFFFGRKVAMG